MVTNETLTPEQLLKEYGGWARNLGTRDSSGLPPWWFLLGWLGLGLRVPAVWQGLTSPQEEASLLGTGSFRTGHRAFTKVIVKEGDSRLSRSLEWSDSAREADSLPP